MNLVGGISLILGVLGIFLPLLPTTPFLLLSSACFMRSNERFHHWIITHPHLGPIIDNWNENKAVTAQVKKRGFILMICSFTFSLIMVPTLAMKIGVCAGFSLLFFFFSRLAVYDPATSVADKKENH